MEPDAGPDRSPPSLPTGWIAQWDANSRKYYFVQISTGVSTWEVPTEPAPTVPTPGSTPAHPQGPFATPMSPDGHSQEGAGTRGLNGGAQNEGQEGERGLGSMAVNALLHSNKPQGQQQHQSGLAGLASSFLGGSSHGNSSGTHSTSGGSSGLVGQLAGSLLGGSHNKPQGQHQGNASSSSSSGLGGMVGSLLGGHSSGQQQQQHQQAQQGYGYSSGGSSQQGSTYTGQAPPASYSGSQHSTPSQYGPSTGAYNPQYGSQQPHQPHQPHHQPGYGSTPSTQYGNPPAHTASSFGQGDQYSQHNQYGGSHHAPAHDQYSQPHHGGFQGAQGGQGAGYGEYPPPPGMGAHGGQHHGGQHYGEPPAYGAPPHDQYSQHQHNQYGGAPHHGGVPPQHGSGHGGEYNGPPPPAWR